ALIVARSVTEDLAPELEALGLGDLELREYPAFNLEEAVIQGVRAEREGALALVCAPIVSTTIEKILHIPVATIQPRESVLRAIALAASKVRN
ncbi:MAG: transcriptional regulator, partial [Thermoplasmata archaeon]|nr:transcriptional regulator [Thermoplasmata archaeon]